MLLMIDNYDSFTYNLVQYLGELGADVKVYRNDAITIDEIERLAPQCIVISPGPRTPNEAGVSLEVVRHFSGRIALLGVCLGHQVIGQIFGARVVHATHVVHGKVSEVYHNTRGVFSGLPNPLQATRYHSLVLDRDALPDCLEVTAWTQDASGTLEEIMGVRHRSLEVEGVQFHPESIMTVTGHALLRNFLARSSAVV